jgi:hypothetical protein
MKRFAIGMIFISLIILIFINIVSASLQGFTQEKDITITVNTDNGLGNYTIYKKIDYITGMQLDFDDLRFTNSSDSELGYWFEDNSYISGTSVNVYVQIGSLVNQTLHMYYGNTTAPTTSDIRKAFILGDDFTESSLNTTRWVLYGGATATMFDNWVNITSNGGNDFLVGRLNITTASNGWEYSTSSKWSTDNSYNGFGTWNDGSSLPMCNAYNNGGGTTDDKRYACYVSSYAYNTRDTNYTQWYIKKLMLNKTTAVFYDNGTFKTSITSEIPNSALNMPITFYLGSGGGTYHTVDWAYMRPIANIEPTISISKTINFNITNVTNLTFTTGNVTSNWYVNIDNAQSCWYYTSDSSTNISISCNTLNISSSSNFSLNGLVAYYKFEEGSGVSVADSTGQGHTATIDGATWVQGIKDNYALEFDGNNDCVTVGESNDFDGDQATIALWTRNISINTNHMQQFMVSHEVSGDNNGYHFQVIYNGTGFNWGDGSGNIAYIDNDGLYFNSTQRFVGQEYFKTKFFVANYNHTSGENHMWHNAVNVEHNYTVAGYGETPAIIPNIAIDNNAGLTIGCIKAGITLNRLWFKGTIDDVMIFNRTLSQDEIYQLYTTNNTAINSTNLPIVTTWYTSGSKSIYVCGNTSEGVIQCQQKNLKIDELNYYIASDYEYTSQSLTGQVAQDTTEGIAGVTNWFPIIITITAMVALILIVALIVIAIRGIGFGGATA